MTQASTPDQQPSGVLIINKPADWTSFDVVAKSRRIFNTKKVGHAGTLDPMATGILIVLIGKATKLSDQLLSQNKRYVAKLVFGQATDTGDADGQITDTADASQLTETDIKTVLPTLCNTRNQMVPSYAAVKVNGKKLYELARAGTPLQNRPIKTITITSIDLLEFNPGDQDRLPTATIDIICSKGTYIRVLAEEIAEKLGTVAHLIALERTASGNYTLDQSVTIQELLESQDPTKYLLPIESIK